MINKIKEFFDIRTKVFIASLSADLLDWLAIIFLHIAFIPTYLMLLSGYTDRMPSLDIALILWSTLALLFLKALVQKNLANIFSIGLGFIIQLFFVGFIFFT